MLGALYKNLMDSEINSWYESYEKYCNEKLPQSRNNRDDAFYNKLVYQRSNGVSSIGLALSRWDKDKRLSKDELEGVFGDFFNNGNDFSNNNYTQLWETFSKKVAEKGASYKPVSIYNRIIAACFPHNVTPVIDPKKLDVLYSWMVDNVFDSNENDSNENPSSWFEKNLKIKKCVAKKLGSNIDDYKQGIFAWKLYEFIVAAESPKAVVKYGAPGTGKTYSAKKQAKVRFLSWKYRFGNGIELKFEETFKIVQFHPSYGYEDFMEGLKPSLEKDKKGELYLADGSFKTFCMEAGKLESELIDKGIDVQSFIRDVQSDKRNELVNGDNREIWSKLLIDNNNSKRIVDVLPPYTFVIDEINRAELSRVFGELMYCLEYRGESIETQYSYLKERKDKKFFIPHNVYVCGTMNTIDRSIESFDYALRRRFRWEEVEPDIDVVSSYLIKNEFGDGDIEKIMNGIESLNQKIAENNLLGPDYRIGHAYFMRSMGKKIRAKKYLEEIWESDIRHLLFEYLRGTGKEYKQGKESSLIDELRKSLFASFEEKDNAKSPKKTKEK